MKSRTLSGRHQLRLQDRVPRPTLERLEEISALGRLDHRSSGASPRSMPSVRSRPFGSSSEPMRKDLTREFWKSSGTPVVRSGI